MVSFDRPIRSPASIVRFDRQIQSPDPIVRFTQYRNRNMEAVVFAGVSINRLYIAPLATRGGGDFGARFALAKPASLARFHVDFKQADFFREIAGLSAWLPKYNFVEWNFRSDLQP